MESISKVPTFGKSSPSAMTSELGNSEPKSVEDTPKAPKAVSSEESKNLGSNFA